MQDQAGYGTQYSDAQADGSSSLFSYAYPNNQYDVGTSFNKFGDQNNIGVLPAPFVPQNNIANR